MGEASGDRSDFGFLVSLGTTLLLLVVCSQVPLLVAFRGHETFGLLLAAGGVVVWKKLGPPPGPGFLTGTICLAGWAACVGSVVICGWGAVRNWL